jgi:RNA polymerase sigma factor (sigma-70 family)
MYYGKSSTPPDMIVLSRQEENRLFRLYRKTKDAQAKELLVRRYLCWAFAIATKLKGPRLPQEDAVAAANHGLMVAIERFKPGRNLRFTTYAYMPVRRHVIEALLATYPVAVTTHMRKKLKKVKEAEGMLSDKSPPRTLTETFDRLSNHTTFGVLENYEVAPGEREEEESPADTVEQADTAEEVRCFIRSSVFSPLERAVLLARHYVEPVESFESIGIRLRVAKKRLRLAYDSAFLKLKQKFSPDAENEAS